MLEIENKSTGLEFGRNPDIFNNSTIDGVTRNIAEQIYAIEDPRILQKKSRYLVEINSRYSSEMTHEFTSHLSSEDKELYKNSYVDQATGLFNRSGLWIIDQLIDEGKDVTIASFDGDHFGEFNNNQELKALFGKEVFGNMLIQLMGKHFHELTQNLRSQGHNVWAMRIGGEEFTIAGEIDPKILEAHLREMQLKLQKEIQSLIPPEIRASIIDRIYEKKYIETLDGEERAAQELGGSTIAIESYSGSILNTIDDVREKITTITDDVLKKRKNEKKGETYRQSIKNADERVRNFRHNNLLDPDQNRQLSKQKDILDKKVEDQLFRSVIQYKPSFKDFIVQHKENLQKLRVFLENPAASNKDQIMRIYQLDKVSLQNFQKAWRKARQDVASYTGAMSIRKFDDMINNHESGFLAENTFRISIQNFKSFNEVAGHIFGDMILTATFQDVLLEAIDACNIDQANVLIAQKGADFYCAVKNISETDKQQFQNRMNSLYSKKLLELETQTPERKDIDPQRRSIDNTSGLSFLERRRKWLRDHQPDTEGQEDQLIFSRYK